MRAISGALIFLILLAIFGVYSSALLSRQADGLNGFLRHMEQDIDAGKWRAASKKLSKLKAEWEKVQFHWDVVIEHHEMDNIDSSLARIDKYINTEDKSQVLAEISSVRHYLKHIPKKEAFTLENIL